MSEIITCPSGLSGRIHGKMVLNTAQPWWV